MRVCEAGLEEGDPCNPKRDRAGCFDTMGISYEEIEKPGFDYVNHLTGESKEFKVELPPMITETTTTETESSTTTKTKNAPRGTETSKSVGMKAVSCLFAFSLLFIL
jgi:hypothetical protein